MGLLFKVMFILCCCLASRLIIKRSVMDEENATERGSDNRENNVLESSDGSGCARVSDKTEKQKVAAADHHEVPYYKLLSFADSVDYALMVIGTITAAGSGICFALMSVLFGELVDSFGMTVDSGKIVGEVSKVQGICRMLLLWLSFLDHLSVTAQILGKYGRFDTSDLTVLPVGL